MQTSGGIDAWEVIWFVRSFIIFFFSSKLIFSFWTTYGFNWANRSPLKTHRSVSEEGVRRAAIRRSYRDDFNVTKLCRTNCENIKRLTMEFIKILIPTRWFIAVVTDERNWKISFQFAAVLRDLLSEEKLLALRGPKNRWTFDLFRAGAASLSAFDHRGRNSFLSLK